MSFKQRFKSSYTMTRFEFSWMMIPESRSDKGFLFVRNRTCFWRAEFGSLVMWAMNFKCWMWKFFLFFLNTKIYIFLVKLYAKKVICMTTGQYCIMYVPQNLKHTWSWCTLASILYENHRPVISQDFSWCQFFFIQISLCLKVFMKIKRSSHQGKKEVACILSSFLFVESL